LIPSGVSSAVGKPPATFEALRNVVGELVENGEVMQSSLLGTIIFKERVKYLSESVGHADKLYPKHDEQLKEPLKLEKLIK
jgi:hypothetical protein